MKIIWEQVQEVEVNITTKCLFNLCYGGDITCIADVLHANGHKWKMCNILKSNCYS